MDVKGIIERTRKAKPVINQLVKDLEKIEDGFDYTKATEDERYFAKCLIRMRQKDLGLAPYYLDLMFAPVKVQGILYQRSDDRFGIKGTDYYFTCGSSCEVLLPYSDWPDDDEDDPYMTWIYTTIEHDPKHKGYYFTARPNDPMSGALVRIKEV